MLELTEKIKALEVHLETITSDNKDYEWIYLKTLDTPEKLSAYKIKKSYDFKQKILGWLMKALIITASVIAPNIIKYVLGG